MRIACFVSPHGFGHAARASAVMEALHRLAAVRFEVFATTPRWFFDESVEGLYHYHEVVTDVGFKQRSALRQDLPATVAALRELLPFDETWVDGMGALIRRTGCIAVLCDIAPVGVAAAERAGVPSILVESFTWPWLYEPLVAEAPELGPLADEIDKWLRRATWHVQTDPLCEADPTADLRVPPIGRRARVERAGARRSLGVSGDERVVLLTMGGVPEDLPFLPRLAALEDITFLVTGARRTRVEGNLRLFDNASRLYLPDLMSAADVAVSKLGYSTVAEAWLEGRPLAYVTRPDFRETGPLGRWVENALPGFEIPGEGFAAGGWIARLPELLELAGSVGPGEGGGDSVARFLLDVIDR